MKLFKKIISLLLITLLLMGLMGCEKLTDLGIPTSKRFPDGGAVNCVWDVKVYDGRVYVGMGDYDENTHPADIWAYDIKKKGWVLSGTVEDEAVTRFIELDETLVSPGIDPSEGWELGNFYTLKNGTWLKNRVLPNVIHNFDIINYDGKTMYSVGSDYGMYPALYTDDGGKTFEYFDFYRNGKLYEVASEDYVRGYEFFEVFDELYLLVHHTYVEIQKASASVFKYDNGAFYYYCDGRDFFKTDKVSVNIVNAKGTLKNNYFYVTDNLYYTSENDTFITKSKVNLPNEERVSSFKIIDGEMIVLSYLKNADETYKISLYKTTNGIENYSVIYSFTYGVPPISFDIYKNYAYLGMGNKNEINDKNGTLLKIRI